MPQRSPFDDSDKYLGNADKVFYILATDAVDIARDDRVSRRCFQLDHLGAGLVRSAASYWAVRNDLIERVASHPKFAADRIGGVVDEMSSERFRERLLSAEQPAIRPRPGCVRASRTLPTRALPNGLPLRFIDHW